jgi:esterase/lipase superfamily enzyme
MKKRLLYALMAGVVVGAFGALLFTPRPKPKTTLPHSVETGLIVGRVETRDGVGIAGADVKVTTAKGTTATESGQGGMFGVVVPKGPFTVAASYGGQSLGERAGTLNSGSNTAIVQFQNDEYRTDAGMATKRLESHVAELEQQRVEDQKKIVQLKHRLDIARAQSAPVPTPIVVNIPPAPTLPPPIESAPPVAEVPLPPAPPVPAPAPYPCTKEGCWIRLYYGTDRARIDDKQAIPVKYRDQLKVYYGGDRGPLTFGECVVLIPPEYKMGSGDLDVGEYTPGKSITLTSIEPREQNVWLDRVRERVASDPEHEILVFIHGFNVSFPDAARRTAQIYYDLGLKGAPVFFSWPSRKGLLNYWADEASVEWATPHLTEFLETLALNTHASHIYLIAHSMGGRAVTSSLAAIGERNKAAHDNHCNAEVPRFSQVFLAAPDLDAEMFKQLKSAVALSADKVTLYASSRDRAMRASQLVHRYPRLGEPEEEWTIDGVTAIDASNAKTDFLGHSYYGSSILYDVLDALQHPDKPIDQRCHLNATKTRGYYPFKRDPDKEASRSARVWHRLTGQKPQHGDVVTGCPAIVTVNGGR